MEQKKAWLYMRIDAPEDTGNLLGQQEKELSEYAKALDMLVVGVSSDMGTRPLDECPGLQGMLLAAANHTMDAVLALSHCHVACEENELAKIIHKLAKYNIDIYTPGAGSLRVYMTHKVY